MHIVVLVDEFPMMTMVHPMVNHDTAHRYIDHGGAYETRNGGYP